MEILPYLERLHPRFGIPTLYVSHSVDEVALLADRILVLGGGRVAARGRTAEVLESLDLGPLAGRFGAATAIQARVIAGRVCQVREDPASAFADVVVDVGTHRVLARVTRLSLHELGLRVGMPVFALLKSVSLSKLRVQGSPDRELAASGLRPGTVDMMGLGRG